jgi:hypothetical protein
MLGRPSSYSDEIADLICARLTEGDSLRTICKAEDMPYIRTVFVWLQKSGYFQQQYARAREIQGQVAAEMAVEAATTARDPQLGRLAYDARKWQASKLTPKVYGDKTRLR